MSDNQHKSFVIYKDSLEILDQLTDEQAGKLFKAIATYQCSGEIIKLDQLLNIVIKPFVNQFKRDAEKWGETIARKRDSANLGNLKRWHEDLYEKVIMGDLDLEKAVSIAKHRGAIKNIGVRSGAIKNIALIADSVNVSGNVSGNGNGNGNGNGRDISNLNQKPLNKKTQTPSTGVCAQQKNTRDREGFKKIGDLVGDLVGDLAEEAGDKKPLEARDILSKVEEFQWQECAPGWDREFLAKEYVDKINSGERDAPRNVKTAFPGWCKYRTGGKRP